MKREVVRRTRRAIADAAREGRDWLSFATVVNDILGRMMPFDRACWHPVDPGTFLFTGALGQNMVCSGAWLAEHEYVLDDVNKWVDLARSGQPARSLSEATGGKLDTSARVRSSAELGLPVGDELRASFVANGVYWAGAGFLRDQGGRRFDEAEVGLVAAISPVIADGFRRAVLVTDVAQNQGSDLPPGVLVLDRHGTLESISPQAERWLEQLVETPPPPSPDQARVVQAVAASARRVEGDPSPPSSARAQTRTGQWLVLYGTGLDGPLHGRVAVIIQPAGPHDVAPLVAQAYGLSERECDVTRLCLRGLATKEIAGALHISPYTVQDHLKSIFDKTGARSRAELVGRVFLEHYVARFEQLENVPPGWNAQATEQPTFPPGVPRG